MRHGLRSGSAPNATQGSGSVSANTGNRGEKDAHRRTAVTLIGAMCLKGETRLRAITRGDNQHERKTVKVPFVGSRVAVPMKGSELGCILD